MKLKKTTDLRQLAVVEVEWADAASHNRWYQAGDLEDISPLRSCTTGYLLEHNKKQLKIAQNVAENGCFSDVMSIPTPWLTKIKFLRKGKVLK